MNRGAALQPLSSGTLTLCDVAVGVGREMQVVRSRAEDQVHHRGGNQEPSNFGEGAPISRIFSQAWRLKKTNFGGFLEVLLGFSKVPGFFNTPDSHPSGTIWFVFKGLSIPAPCF